MRVLVFDGGGYGEIVTYICENLNWKNVGFIDGYKSIGSKIYKDYKVVGRT